MYIEPGPALPVTENNNEVAGSGVPSFLSLSFWQQELPCGFSGLPGYVRTQHQPWIWVQVELWDFSEKLPELGRSEENLVWGVRGSGWQEATLSWDTASTE